MAKAAGRGLVPGWLTLAALVGFVGWMALMPAAAQTTPPEVDAALAEHVQRLSSGLRCVVCQNQTVADSQAPLAVALRAQVHEQLAAGASDAQVLSFMAERYGDFVLYRPPFKPLTWALWLGPLALLGLGLGWLWLRLRTQAQRPDAATNPEGQLEPAPAAALASVPEAAPEPTPPKSTPPGLAGPNAGQLRTTRWQRVGAWVGVPLLAVALYASVGRPDVLLHTRPPPAATDEVQALLDRAVTLAMQQPQGLAGEPEALIQQALQLAPTHPQALALAGSARLDQGDAAGAIAHWEQLLSQVEAGSELARTIQQSMARAQQVQKKTPDAAPTPRP